MAPKDNINAIQSILRNFMGKAKIHKKLRQISKKSMKQMASALWSVKPWYISKKRWSKVINKLMV